MPRTGPRKGVHLGDVAAKIKHERQTVRTTKSSHGELMYQMTATVQALDGLIGQNGTGGLNGRHIICPESFRELYMLKWVTQSQRGTSILSGNRRERSKANVHLLTCWNPVTPMCLSDPVFGYKHKHKNTEHDCQSDIFEFSFCQ